MGASIRYEPTSAPGVSSGAMAQVKHGAVLASSRLSRCTPDTATRDNRMMARRVSSPAFIGRETELTWLRAMFDQARGDRASIALVGGDPGIGKTRLVAEFVAWAHEQGTP